MKRHNYIISSLIILFSIGILFYFGDEQTPEDILVIQNKPEPMRKPLIENSSLRNTGTPTGSAPTLDPSEIESLRDAMPETQDVKAEAGKNPHSTPRSLIKFAEELGPMMEKALNNSVDADLMMKEFFDCVADESIAVTARALCVSNAEKIAQNFPAMKGKANDIESMASPEVTKLQAKKKLFQNQ